VAITTIPAAYRGGFARIKRLSSSDVDALVAALENAPSPRGLKELASAIVDKVPSLKRGDAESLLRTLFSLYVFLASDETPLSEYLSDLSGAMRASGRPDLDLSEQEKTDFEEKMRKLLSVKTVELSSKVQSLKVEYPCTFYDTMILTDIRPLFDNVQERPVGATITHTLKIVYHEGGDHKEFYVALEAEDLQKLKKVLQRAEIKELSLKSFLKVSDLPELS
jgi:hypothetical protein